MAYLDVEDALRFEVQPCVVNQGMWAYTSGHGYARISDGVRVTIK
jgi:hypothetical protein